MKRNTLKKWVAMLCSTTMVMALTACGSNQEKTDESAKNTQPVEESTQPAEQSTQATEQNNETIKIGVAEDLSGIYATYGLTIVPGMELAVEEINANGGVLGRELELIITDTQSDVSIMQQMSKKLIESDKVDVLMGGVTSSQREAVRPIVDQLKILYFYPQEYEGGVADHYTFCTAPLCAEQMAIPGMEEVVSSMGMENPRVYILVPDYNFGQIMKKYIEETTTRLGGTVVGMEAVPAEVTNYSTTISNMVASSPDMIVACISGSTMSAFYEQWAAEGIPGIPVVTHMACVADYEHKIFDKGVMNNVYATAAYCEELDSDAAKAYTEKIKPRLEENGIPYCTTQSEFGYVTVYLYAKAVEQAGTTETEAVITSLESGAISMDAPSGTITVRGEDHQTIRDMTLFKCDENNVLNVVKKMEGTYSTFVEDRIKEEFGVDGGLKGLAAAGKDAPNTQYVPDIN